MVSQTVYNELTGFLPGQVRVEEPMRKHTSWRIGGPSEIFVEPAGSDELKLVLSYTHMRGIPVTVIGAGSNLLVSESGIRGVVVRIGGSLGKITTVENGIRAGAGAKLAAVAAKAWNAGLGGLEFSTGIPGSIGGAVVMNAGANGSSIGALVREVLLLDYRGEILRKTKEEMRFGYRTSILQHESLIVIEAIFSGYLRDKKAIQEDMESFSQRRRLTQPLGQPSAGSVFKNPEGEPVGRLIEMAGLKGMRIGDAQISALHANFIVNLGLATARDVLTLIERVKEEVYRRFGVELKLEVRLIGDN